MIDVQRIAAAFDYAEERFQCAVGKGQGAVVALERNEGISMV